MPVIMINPGGSAVTILQQASPFLACSITVSPGTPTRNLSASVTAALTTLSGLVIPAEPPPLVAMEKDRPAPLPGWIAIKRARKRHPSSALDSSGNPSREYLGR